MMKQPLLKKNFTHILSLAALLVVIFLIMTYLRHGKSGLFAPTIPEFEDSAKIVDQKYYNKAYQFGISLPNASWEMVSLQQADSLHRQDNSRSILENINVLLEMYRRDKADTLAIVQVGLIDLIEPHTPNSLAEQNLREIASSVARTDSIHIVKDVTLSGSGRLTNAYYVIEFVEKLPNRYPIWVAMFVVNNKMAYTTFCKVRSENYEVLRTDFETILKSFRLY
jgi:hypothetical protein